MRGTLYVVSTPIGNLGDMTYRGVDVLKSVDLIACEDTRESKKLLNHYDIHKPMVSLFQGRERERSEKVLSELQGGKDIALISDAGTPNIQDPGYRLIHACRELGIEVLSVPGACAVVSALSISGLPTNAFLFEGFLPVKSGPRKIKIEGWKREERTVICYESPYKLVRTLEDLRTVLGNISITLARELTKKFEECVTGTVDEFLNLYRDKKPKGEIVLLVNLKDQK